MVGPNGAGKSTLVQLVAGGLKPGVGHVRIDGETVTSAGVHVPPHRRRCSLVGQRPLLFPHLSVLDNVAFGPVSRGVPRRAARRRAAAELEQIGVGDLAPRKPSTLSGGQAQRVAVARALAIDPEIVLLDEPFAALDATVAPALRLHLRERLTGITTVLVTHDFLDVVSLASSVIELADGRVVDSGSVDAMYARPTTAFLAQFAGLDLLRGTATGDTLELAGGVIVTGTEAETGYRGPARAAFPPSAVAVYRAAPEGSPRNALPASVTAVEDRRPVQRVTLEIAGQAVDADLTPAAVRDLELAPGAQVFAVIKATEISIYPAPATG